LRCSASLPVFFLWALSRERKFFDRSAREQLDRQLTETAGPITRGLRVRLDALASEASVTFEDQGVGIAREHIPRVFEGFFRAPRTESSEVNDSGYTQSGGLGLAIATAIVRTHGGSIECQSQLGVGSVFTIRLPFRFT
jgi:two-component system, OmpR family, phosphate regulon sensor histidine kinase PhoR